MTTEHPAPLIEELRRITTPTVSNAIERFGVRPRNQGFTSGQVGCVFPDLPAMVGYACTATIKADKMGEANERLPAHVFWDHVLSMPAPRVIVIKDEDDPPAVGSFWGEVNSSVFMALGAVGVLTDGGVRDLDEVHQMGFQFFARDVIVSHAYVHLTGVGEPVKIAGLEIKPGDLLHGDKHGVIHIPHEIADGIPDAARKVEAFERPIIELCHAPDFSVEKLRALFGVAPTPNQAVGAQAEKIEQEARRDYH